ncbi:hypothetical protein [Fischerella sp. PCC 9605]|uniref:hypothetical protein n=1 Tax=Fischerella sp. PCC 9605 TaxID=1173024 RepID=UPI00047ED247|nr:hypothetical protein [Fischerella sp. PCC 9605]
MKTPTKVEYLGYSIEISKIAERKYAFYIRGHDVEDHESGFKTPRQALIAAKGFLDAGQQF